MNKITSIVSSVVANIVARASDANIKKAKKCERILSSQTVVDTLERIEFFAEALQNVNAHPMHQATAKAPVVAQYALEKIAQNAHCLATGSHTLANTDIHTVTVLSNAVLAYANTGKPVVFSFANITQQLAFVESEANYEYIKKFSTNTADTQRRTSATALALLGAATLNERILTLDFSNAILRELCASLPTSDKLRKNERLHAKVCEALQSITEAPASNEKAPEVEAPAQASESKPEAKASAKKAATKKPARAKKEASK